MEPPHPSRDDAEPAPVRFRSSKRRKTYRQRARDPDSLAPPAAHGSGSGGDDDDDDDEDDDKDGGPGGDDASGPSRRGAPVVRPRGNPRRGARFRGIGFSSASRPDPALLRASKALVARGQDAAGAEDEKPVVRGIADRFMHQTGLVADPDDRHMTEYIESRLSSRIAASSTPRPPAVRPLDPPSPPPAPAPASVDGQPPAPSTASAVRAGDQPTKHGKLFEVDIPADVRNRRDDTRKRLAEKAPRPRFGRNRRNSDDIKRDQFVEQFLHENRLDVYDFPNSPIAPPSQLSASSTSATAASGDHRTADDRMAEQFRRQYLDDLAQRRQRRRHAHPPRQQPPPGDVLRGPKLGGSRNSRAAVRNLLLQQEKEKLGRKV